MSELSIGHMAQLNCTTEKALRLYQQKGLLEPARICEKTGYRYYSYEQSSILDLIQQFQALGFSLDEIKELLDSHEMSKFVSALENHLATIESQLSDLVLARQTALNLLDTYRLVQNKPECDTVMVEQMDQRTILTFPIFNENSVVITEESDTFLEEWETNLRLTKKHMRETGMPLQLFKRVGCLIDRQDVLNRAFSLKAAYVFVDASDFDLSERCQTVPAGTYLTLYKDRYKEDDGSNAELQGLRQLMDYAETEGYTLTGDYLGEVVADTPAFLYTGREMLLKLQIPVKHPRDC